MMLRGEEGDQGFLLVLQRGSCGHVEAVEVVVHRWHTQNHTQGSVMAYMAYMALCALRIPPRSLFFPESTTRPIGRGSAPHGGPFSHRRPRPRPALLSALHPLLGAGSAPTGRGRARTFRLPAHRDLRPWRHRVTSLSGHGMDAGAHSDPELSEGDWRWDQDRRLAHLPLPCRSAATDGGPARSGRAGRGEDQVMSCRSVVSRPISANAIA